MTSEVAPSFAGWLSTPHVAAVEILAQTGYDSVVLDMEHGTFSAADLNYLVPLARALGLITMVKAAGPTREAVQTSLDSGADAVVIPHVLGADHAREVTSFAKVPPLGDRSLAGGRTMQYGGFGAEWAGEENRRTQCIAMIEDVSALMDVAEILALPTVDGVFVGPGDLFVRRGTGGFARTEADYRDMGGIAAAARESGKPWIMPAWTPGEQKFAIREGAACIAVLQEHAALGLAFGDALAQARALVKDASEYQLAGKGLKA